MGCPGAPPGRVVPGPPRDRLSWGVPGRPGSLPKQMSRGPRGTPPGQLSREALGAPGFLQPFRVFKLGLWWCFGVDSGIKKQNFFCGSRQIPGLPLLGSFLKHSGGFLGLFEAVVVLWGKMEGPRNRRFQCQKSAFFIAGAGKYQAPPLLGFFEAFCGFFKLFGPAVVLWGNACRT